MVTRLGDTSGLMKLSDRRLILGAAALSAMLVFATAAFSLGADPQALTWTKVVPTNRLPPRTFFATAYDPISKKVVVFGGSDAWDSSMKPGRSMVSLGRKLEADCLAGSARGRGDGL